MPTPSRSRLTVACTLVALPILLAGCTGADGTAPSAESSRSTSAAPPLVATPLPSDVVERLGATPGTEATPQLDTPAPTVAATPAVTPTTAVAADALAQSIDGIAALPVATPAADDGYVLRTSALLGFSVEAPASWSVVSDVRLDDGAGLVLHSSPEQDVHDSGAIVQQSSRSAAELFTDVTRTYLSDCALAGTPTAYDDGRLVGTSQVFTQCDGTGTTMVIAFTLKDGSTTQAADFDVTLIDQADTAALSRMLQTFRFGG